MTQEQSLQLLLLPAGDPDKHVGMQVRDAAHVCVCLCCR